MRRAGVVSFVIFVLCAGVGLATSSCSSSVHVPGENATSVRDVSGLAFGWQCDADGCGIVTNATTPAPDPCASGASEYGWDWGRFFEICSVCSPGDGTWGTTPGQCRILACATDADCPVVSNDAPPSVYRCGNGLCENADTQRFPKDRLKRFEVEQLCFAPRARADTRTPLAPVTEQVEAEVDATCGQDALAPCIVPADCRAP